MIQSKFYDTNVFITVVQYLKTSQYGFTCPTQDRSFILSVFCTKHRQPQLYHMNHPVRCLYMHARQIYSYFLRIQFRIHFSSIERFWKIGVGQPLGSFNLKIFWIERHNLSLEGIWHLCADFQYYTANSENRYGSPCRVPNMTEKFGRMNPMCI